MSTLKLNQKRITFTPPMRLSELLEREGISHPHPCGGRGTCGKCAVRIEGALSPLTAAELKAGTRLSCQTTLLGDATLTVSEGTKMQIEGTDNGDTPVKSDRQRRHAPLNPNDGDAPTVSSSTDDKDAPIRSDRQRRHAAVDIGTTTVVVQVYDDVGRLCGSAAELNPQSSVAADVMGRINAALNGKAELLQQQILETLKRLLHEAAGEHYEHLKKMVITGNTTMLYLLTGRNPESLATAPFEADHLFDGETEILGIPTLLPPCISAFVGADITCALLASGICEGHETALLCDIGTNGELALWHNGTLTVTSTAAGPVFEGAGIVKGMLGQSGAIESVTFENGKLVCRTIDGLPARGICGSGLIDAVAAGLEAELIDDTGFLEEDPLPLMDGICLYGQDVRSLQLAKSAVASGIGALLHYADLAPKDIARCVIAGGFGKHLNLKSASRIGILPGTLAENADVIGNAALAGAAMLLLHPEIREQARSLAQKAKHIELGGDPTFNELYIENMMFE